MDFILWELPYVTALGMLHAEAVYNDVAVEYVQPRETKKPGGLAAQFAAMKKKN